MSVGSPVAADVPRLFDVIIDGHGYILLRTLEQSLPFRTQRADYTHSPTFLARTNVQGDYSDNQQDFWLTASQRDWSLGEDQKFFKSTDEEKVRQFWLGQNINVSTPGQITLERAVTTLTFAGVVLGAGAFPVGAKLFVSTTTNLYEIASDGTVTDRGAHGAGGAVSAYCTDGVYLYLSGAATTVIRQYDLTAHTFSTFSTQIGLSMCFLNNTLYSVASGVAYRYDTAGVAAEEFTWKSANGATQIANNLRVQPYGGKVSVLKFSLLPGGSELWEFTDAGAVKTAEFPPNFRADDFCVSSGIIFVAGVEGKVGEGFRTAIYYYANGTFGRAWTNPGYTTGTVGYAAVAPFGDGVVFTDVVNGGLRFYDLSIGGVSTVATYTPTGANRTALAVANQYVLLTQGTTGGVMMYGPAKATSGFVESSIVDFDSSLTKLFRGVIVDWVAATDGDGGSVDIAYQVDDVAGSYTNLRTGAVSGTEYTFPGVTKGRGLSLKITLNKGTSTLGPTVKRTYMRAAPILQSYRQVEYILDLTGVNGSGPVILNDNETAMPLDGKHMALNLNAAIVATSPISITDCFGTYTAIVKPDESELIEVAPDEYIARLHVREV